MSFLSYIFPRTIVRTSTSYNRDIRVIEDAGSYKLMVNGIHQSSEYIRKFWTHAVTHLHVTEGMQCKNILYLGVAGGTIVHILSKMFPRAQMTGVDIDAVMIELGKKYFGLGQMQNLSFVTADAKSYIGKTKGKFDLIVVDIYLARDLPDFLRDKKFLGDIRSKLLPHGHMLMNYLRDGEYKDKAEDLDEKLKDVFREVHHTNYLNNRFFLARK